MLKKLILVAVEVCAPMSAEPRVAVTSAVNVGADEHVFAGDATVEMSSFVHRKSRWAVAADFVFVEKQARLHRGVSAAVSRDRHDLAVRMDNPLVGLDAGFCKRELEGLIAHAPVAETISLRRPESDFVRAGFAPDPVELDDLSLPASAEH